MIRWLTRLTALALLALVAVVSFRIFPLPEPERVLPPLTGTIDLIEISLAEVEA